MNRRIRKAINYAIIGFVIDMLLLTLVIISYSTVSVTLVEAELSFIFKFFSILYSWPFLILAFLFNIIGIELFSTTLLFITSAFTYSLLGYLIGYYYIAKKKSV